MSGLGQGCYYFKSFHGIIKIIEFVVLLIALGTVGYFFEEMGDDAPRKNKIKFFLIVVITAWVLVMAFWLNFVSGLHEKMSAINWALVDTVVFAIWAILLLVASSFLADTVVYYKDKYYCRLLDIADTKQQCEHLIVGAIFGFISMLLFIVDAVIHFLYRHVHITTRSARSTRSTTTTTTITVG